MNGQRIGAVVIAIALVVGAFVIRRNVIEDDDDNATADGTEVDEPDREDATALLCITELTEVCEELAATHDELDVTIEDAGETLDRMAALGDEEQVPLWLTTDPYPAMVDLLRPNDAVGFETQAVGSSQLAVAFPTGPKAAAIAEFCGGESLSLWRCLGDRGGDSWSELGAASTPGMLSPSLGDVNQSALALASLSHAVASYYGEPDVTRSELDSDTPFITWFRGLSGVSTRAALSGGTPLRTMATRPALDAAATATFEVTELDATGDRFEVNYSEPQMWIQAVIATPAGVSAPNGLAADVTSALEAVGWDPVAAADGPAPSASTLLTLRQLWNDYTT